MKREFLQSTVPVTAVLFVVLSVCTLASVLVPASESKTTLTFRFIGNEAFEISDGSTTLLSDFPYEPGAFGYMEYKFDDVRPSGNVICLITHEHRDHFDASLFLSQDWSVFAAPGITKGLPEERVIAFQDTVRIGALEIQAIKTPHTQHHYSYIVTWHGVRMYFTGDTESPESLLAAEELDVAFVSPWLLETIADSKEAIDAARIIVYHHTASQTVKRHQDAIVPKQGDTFEFQAAAEPAN